MSGVLAGDGGDERTAKAAGHHRTVTPAQTLSWITPKLAELGITRVGMITGLDVLGVPVATACRPTSRGLCVSQGKGLTAAAAQVSAIMESVESFHAERIRASVRIASVSELASSVDVRRLPTIPGRSVDPGARIAWIEGIDIGEDEPVWCPYESVSTDWRLPLPPQSGALRMDTNGLGSGNHLIEAVRHGISEVVERDALARWNTLDTESRHRTRVDPRTIDDEQCGELVDSFAASGILTSVWDVTSPVGLPAFLVMVDPGGTRWDQELVVADGAGCSPSRSEALLRALTEAAQTRVTTIAGSREDIRRRHYDPIHTRLRAARRRSRLGDSTGRQSYRDVPEHSSDSLADEVRTQLTLLRKAGVRQVVMVNLTLPELGVPVVRVVVPGLEGASAVGRYAVDRGAAAVH